METKYGNYTVSLILKVVEKVVEKTVKRSKTYTALYYLLSGDTGELSTVQ